MSAGMYTNLVNAGADAALYTKLQQCAAMDPHKCALFSLGDSGSTFFGLTVDQARFAISTADTKIKSLSNGYQAEVFGANGDIWNPELLAALNLQGYPIVTGSTINQGPRFMPWDLTTKLLQMPAQAQTGDLRLPQHLLLPLLLLSLPLTHQLLPPLWHQLSLLPEPLLTHQLILTIAATNAPTRTPTVAPTVAAPLPAAWEQCGDQGWTDPTGCVSGYTCVFSSIWYSQCLPSSSVVATPAPTLAPTVVNTATQALWGKCGGQGWTGPTTCVAGATYSFQSIWYSQCIPARRNLRTVDLENAQDTK